MHGLDMQSRALGWASNSGNYFGADGSQGTVINVNVTQGTHYRLTLYMVSGVNTSDTYPGTPTHCPSTGACGYNRPCAQQYVVKYQSCMVISGRLSVHARHRRQMR